MSDESKDKRSVDSDTPTVNMEEIAPAGSVKGLDANRYATKKTVAQGMLDIALLTSNASQLKYVLQVGPKHEFYTLLVVLISISIVLQVISAIVAIVLSSIYNINREPDLRKAEVLNNTSLAFKTVSIMLNVVISALSSMQIDSASLAIAAATGL